MTVSRLGRGTTKDKCVSFEVTKTHAGAIMLTVSGNWYDENHERPVLRYIEDGRVFKNRGQPMGDTNEMFNAIMSAMHIYSKTHNKPIYDHTHFVAKCGPFRIYNTRSNWYVATKRAVAPTHKQLPIHTTNPERNEIKQRASEIRREMGLKI